jgi:hypothetical protein
MPKIPDWLSWIVIGLVSGMAATNFIANIFVKNYHTDPAIYATFTAVVSAVLFGRRGKDGDGGDAP